MTLPASWVLLGFAGGPISGAPSEAVGRDVASLQIRLSDQKGKIAVRGLPGARLALESRAALLPASSVPWAVVDRFVLDDQGAFSVERPLGDSSEFFRVVAEPGRFWTNMVVIPAGEFQMGSSDWGPIQTVMLSEFAMDCFEVTKQLWDEVRNWGATNGYSLPVGKTFGNAFHPVHSVGWYDMLKWCNARSEKEGMTPAYYSDVTLTKVYKSGSIVPYVNWNQGYRLPTESEWEKAARGGTVDGKFPWAAGDSIAPSRANYVDSGIGMTTPVGSYPPNPFGIYDLSGNLEERCWDAVGPYPGTRQEDPRGANVGLNRVIRGGHWNSQAVSCQVSDRGDLYPDNWGSAFRGFRCVRSGFR